MRLSTLLLAAVPVTAIPFTGPNYLPQFPEPVIPLAYDLDLAAIQRENPQWSVHYTGGLVGLYGHRQGEVIWTTPWTPWEDRWDEPERVYGRPIPGCNSCVPVLPPPVDEPYEPTVDVPETSGWLMLAIGLAAMGLRRMGR